MNEFVVTINKSRKGIKIIDEKTAVLDGNKYDCELFHVIGESYLLKIGDKFFEVSAEKIDDEKFAVLVDAQRLELEIRTLLRENALKLLSNQSSAHAATEIKAPMPGMILKIKKKQGESIAKGESILILEAMKMENELRSPVEGSVTEIFIKEGEPVEKGTKLLKIA